MKLTNARAAGTPGLAFTPPRFVDSNVPAVLIVIDAELEISVLRFERVGSR
jgi:hypothetical protein